MSILELERGVKETRRSRKKKREERKKRMPFSGRKR
jgi:hypothetical protein